MYSLIDVGLISLILARSDYTLFGGEAQKMMLARKSSKSNIVITLYILDEPTTA